MKSVKTLCAACALALVFTTAVRADDGYIGTGAPAPPAQRPRRRLTATSARGWPPYRHGRTRRDGCR